MPSPFELRRFGASGLPVSSIFPELGSLPDELAVVRSMTSTVNEHAQGNYFMHRCQGTPTFTQLGDTYICAPPCSWSG